MGRHGERCAFVDLQDGWQHERISRYLVTGALGCIGAWVVRNLVREGAAVFALDAAQDDHRLRLALDPAELADGRIRPDQIPG